MATKLMEKENGWELKDSNGSCLELGVEEQCVKKAAAVITILKDQLVVWKEEEIKMLQIRSPYAFQGSNCYHHSPDHRPDSVVSFYPTTSNDLVVEGLKTGISKQVNQSRNRFEWSKIEEVITHLLHLISCLENDRRLTVMKWEEEREKVMRMRRLLDEKSVQRLKILPILVQQEHERCLRDLVELRWHVAFEGRQLQYIRDEVKVVSETNQEFKSNLERVGGLLVLLQEKLEVEGDKMAAIIRRQEETEEELKKRRGDLNKTAEKAHQTRARVNSEIKQMERTMKEMKGRLDKASETLSCVNREQVELTVKISSTKTTIASNTKERTVRSAELDKLKTQKKLLEKQVLGLKELQSEKKGQANRLMERNLTLKRRKKDRYSRLDSEHTVLLSEVQRWSKELKEARQQNEDLIHEMDEMKEEIGACNRQYKDDIKSIERAHKELVKVDKQLQVVEAQTNLIRNEHRELTENIREEELKLGNTEDSLRIAVQSLKQDYQKETRIKITYQGKIQADKADLAKLRAEHQRTEKKARSLAQKMEARKKESQQEVARLEETHQTKYKQEAGLREQINETRIKLQRVENELGGKHSSLIEKEREISGTVTTIRSKVSQLKERVKMLEEKIENTSKSTKMIQRMENDTSNTIQALESKKTELEDKLEAEKLEEESWRQELEEITGFSRRSKEKYTLYLIEREKLLDKLERDELSAAEMNRLLARDYEKLRTEHVKVKTKTLQVLEHQLELEAALKDLRQLLALQTKLSTTMKAYYKHRSAKGKRDLHSFRQKASETELRVGELQVQLEETLDDIGQFLRGHNREQTKLLKSRSERGGMFGNGLDTGESNTAKDTRQPSLTGSKNKNGKKVSFTQHLVECVT